MRLPRDWKTAEYGSHLHLLRAVFDHFKPRRVLETGSGRYSTAFFLAQDIDELASVENNSQWFRRSEDPRHESVYVKGPVADALPPLDGFDLVFVDDDPVEDRERTIRLVLARAQGLVVIHDTEYEPYHMRIKNRPNYTDTGHRPHTTVLHPTESKEFAAWLATA